MALSALQLSVEMAQIVCGSCSGVYAITERVREYHQAHGTSWTCPYCQTGWGYSGRGALQKAEKALAEERERHQTTLARLNETATARDKAERKLRRVKRGVCPECNRSFANLASHMACKHAKK